MRLFISAGEASGDLHASELIRALKELDPEVSIEFLGGDLMCAAAGHAPLTHIRDMAYMGFVDVALHLRTVLSNLSRARAGLQTFRPDALILVDYPSFNLRLAATARKCGIPVFWYISPKVWAWKTGRIRSMKRLIECVYSILPFEPDFLRAHGYDRVLYVGNPSLEEVDRKVAALPGRGELMRRFGLDLSRPLLTLVPGSRAGELRDNLPVMAEVASRHPGLQTVVAGAPSVDPELYRRYGPGLKVVTGATFELMRLAEAALVTSGTATLECALLGTPQVACYRSSGSRIVYSLFRRILKIPYVTLPNLIAGKGVIDEMLMHRCTPDGVDQALRPLLSDTPQRREMLAGYAAMRSRLGSSGAAATAAADIIRRLK